MPCFALQTQLRLPGKFNPKADLQGLGPAENFPGTTIPNVTSDPPVEGVHSQTHAIFYVDPLHHSLLGRPGWAVPHAMLLIHSKYAFALRCTADSVAPP